MGYTTYCMLHCIVSSINKYVLNKKGTKKRQKQGKKRREKEVCFSNYVALYILFNK